MKKCNECGKEMKQLKDKTPEGIKYDYFKCSGCGEEIVTMQQLHDVAGEYRALKKYTAKLSKWGLSLGVRIPKELVQKYHLKDNSDITIIPEDDGMRLVTV
jgi:DNA-directed RNA polymerase subunit RPC12/RpoP